MSIFLGIFLTFCLNTKRRTTINNFQDIVMPENVLRHALYSYQIIWVYTDSLIHWPQRLSTGMCYLRRGLIRGNYAEYFTEMITFFWRNESEPYPIWFHAQSPKKSNMLKYWKHYVLVMGDRSEGVQQEWFLTTTE